MYQDQIINNVLEIEKKNKIKFFSWYKNVVNYEDGISNISSTNNIDNYKVIECTGRVLKEDDNLSSINDLKQLIKFDSFELGKASETEDYFMQLLLKSKDAALVAINQVYHDAIVADDKHSILGVLYVLASMDYDKITPIGPTIAAAAITTDDREIVRYAIMAFEYWNNPVAIKYFESIKIQSKWIDKYKHRVISKLTGVV